MSPTSNAIPSKCKNKLHTPNDVCTFSLLFFNGLKNIKFTLKAEDVLLSA